MRISFKQVLYEKHINKYDDLHEELNLEVQEGSKVNT
jgi:hypothetical protein